MTATHHVVVGSHPADLSLGARQQHTGNRAVSAAAGGATIRRHLRRFRPVEHGRACTLRRWHQAHDVDGRFHIVCSVRQQKTAAARLGALLSRRPGVGRWLDRFTGLVFVGLAARLALDSSH